MMVRDILLLDSNVVRKLNHEPSRERLKANLRATGREFWPTGLNVLEALKSRDYAIRTRLLNSLKALAGDNHAFPLPTEALKLNAEALASNAPTIAWSEPRLTSLFRDPGDVTESLAAETREYLIDQEKRFDATHRRAREELLPMLKELGGRDRWPTLGGFLDEVWNRRAHLGDYVSRLWEEWNFAGSAPVDAILADRAWTLYFEGWGAAMYARTMAHPQPRKVESADLTQLVYCGCARSTLVVSDDRGFRELAGAILSGRHPRMEVVPLSAMTT